MKRHRYKPCGASYCGMVVRRFHRDHDGRACRACERLAPAVEERQRAESCRKWPDDWGKLPATIRLRPLREIRR